MIRTEGELQVEAGPRLTRAFDWDGSGNLIYFGLAARGSSKSAAAWRLMKLTYDGSNNVVDIQWANGSDGFTSVWDNRAALSYS